MAKNTHKGGRKVRVAAAIHENLAELIDREVKDPRIRVAGMFTINKVELTSDMGVAYVYTSFFGATDAAIAEAMDGLNAARGYLRGPLARRMNLAHAPELRFKHDTSTEFTSKLHDIVAEDAARSVPEEPDDEG